MRTDCVYCVKHAAKLLLEDYERREFSKQKATMRTDCVYCVKHAAKLLLEDYERREFSKQKATEITGAGTEQLRKRDTLAGEL